MRNGGESVCIQEENMSRYVRPRFEGHIQYLTLKMNDDEDQNLISLFIESVFSHISTPFLCLNYNSLSHRAKLFIDKAIAEGGRALVHDNIGLSLAPAIAIMFAMHHYQLNWEDAMHMVQNRRYCISLNQGFLKQLKVC
jgi:serine/threonine/tyrosine-interacting protein